MRGLSAEQKAERKLGIGGSDAGRVMAGDWTALWREKTGRSEPEDLSWKIPVQIGHCTEQFNAEYFEHVTGRAVTCRNELVVSKQYPFMRVNMDGITKAANGRPAYWDAKHVGRSDEATILRYSAQMHHACAVLGYEWWILSIFVGNSRHEIVEQQIDPFYLEELIATEAEFWGYVERDEEPRDRAEPTLAPKPEKRLRNIDLGTEFGTPAWDKIAAQYNWANEARERIVTFTATDAAAKAHAISREELKATVPDDVGELRRGTFLFTRNKAGAITMRVAKPEIAK